MTPQEHHARLMAAWYAVPPFQGRARLLKLASKIGEPVGESALLALEMTPREQEIAALRGTLHPKVVQVLRLERAERIMEAKRTRERRRGSTLYREEDRYRYQPVYQSDDPLAARSPGEALQRFTFARFEAALRRFRPRRASNGHENVIVFVPVGQENAVSEAKYVPPEYAGLPRKYRYWVLQSKHFWYVSPAILHVPIDEQTHDALYLAPNVRVRQGRQFKLVVEHAPFPPLRERQFGASRRRRRGPW